MTLVRKFEMGSKSEMYSCAIGIAMCPYYKKSYAYTRGRKLITNSFFFWAMTLVRKFEMGSKSEICWTMFGAFLQFK